VVESGGDGDWCFCLSGMGLMNAGGCDFLLSAIWQAVHVSWFVWACCNLKAWRIPADQLAGSETHTLGPFFKRVGPSLLCRLARFSWFLPPSIPDVDTRTLSRHLHGGLLYSLDQIKNSDIKL
jgi:hypothetical protein